MKSMTGYGKAVTEEEGKNITVEIKSVNHRFFDLNLKVPKLFLYYEDKIRKQINTFISRGHVDAFITISDFTETNAEIEVNYNLANQYITITKELAEKYELKNDFQVNALIKPPDILNIKANTDSDEDWENMLNNTLENALKALDSMRETEGSKLKNDILYRLNTIENLVNDIKILAPSVVKDYRDRLNERMKELLSDNIDETRFNQEIAYYADKSNIDEELTRLTSHIDQAKVILNSVEPIGRQMDFLIQEFNREVNTICSKSNNINITKSGLTLKNEIEKIREQIQNIE